LLTGTAATIAGGTGNLVNGNYSAVGAGRVNAVTGEYSNIGAGRINSVVGSNSTIAGGYWNRVSGDSSVIGGGSINFSTGLANTIAGGTGNQVTGNYSAVGGGGMNFISGNYSNIFGGQSNTIASNYSSILGGSGNITSGNYSLIGAGVNAQIPSSHVGAAIFADGQNRVHQSKYEHSLSLDFASGIYASGDLSIGGTVNALSYVNNPTSKTIFVDAGVGTDNRQLQSVDGKQNSTQLSKYDQFKPFATISGAVAASSVGDLVVVRAGDYTISSAMNLNNKGNLYFEPNTNISTTINGALFNLSLNESKQIQGHASFSLNGASSELLSISNGSVLFECDSVNGSTSDVIFATSGNAVSLDVSIPQITTENALVFLIEKGDLIVRNCYNATCNKFLSSTTSGNIKIDTWQINGKSDSGIIELFDHTEFSYRGVSLNNTTANPCIVFAYSTNGIAPVIHGVKLKTSGIPIYCDNNGTFRDIFLDNVKINSTNISNPSISSSPSSTTLYSTATYSNVAPDSSVTVDGQYNIMTKIF
jgi:hypothetical protein